MKNKKKASQDVTSPALKNKEKQYSDKVAQARRVIQTSFLKEILYIQDEMGDFVENPNITDISFNGTEMYIQDNELGRYKVDSERDPRIKQGMAPLEVSEEDVSTLGRLVANTMSENWNNTNPILDSELGELRTNFMHKAVSPFGVTFALRVSRPRLAITNIADMCDDDTAKLLEVFMRCGFNLLISGITGSGKALINSSKIPTPNGFIPIGDLKVGDLVFNRLGKPKKVSGVYPQGRLKVFKIDLSDGREILCNDEHIWSVVDNKGNLVNKTVKEMVTYVDGSLQYVEKQRIPLNKAVEYPEAFLETAPYEQGVLVNEGMELPEEYLIASLSQRYELLRGILGNDGIIYDTGKVSYKTFSKSTAEKILNVLYSLGISGVLYESDGIVDDKHTIIFKTNKEILRNIFTNTEQLKIIDELSLDFYKETISIFDIVETDLEDEMTCIMVDDEEHLFLANDYVVTHNTEFQKALIGYIPDSKKISLMEDTLDSHIKAIYPHKDINSWATAGEKGSKNYIGFPELIKSGLRNNPDWLMISEVRGAEAQDLLSAALTGHHIMTTIHATGADNIPSRLSNMVAMGGTVNFDALQRDIVSVLSLGMHLAQVTDENGRITRIVREIYEYLEYRPEVGIIGKPIYQVVQNYDERTNTYSTETIKERLSSNLLEKIKNNREIHNVPNAYRYGNEY